MREDDKEWRKREREKETLQISLVFTYRKIFFYKSYEFMYKKKSHIFAHHPSL